MVTVRLYGRLTHRYDVKATQVPPGSLEEIIGAIVEKHPEIRPEDLKNARPIVKRAKAENDRQSGTQLQSGDELIFMSPVGGG